MNTEHVRPKALVVDDAPDILHVLTEALKDDYAIVAATTGEKALELLAKPPYPSVILLDVQLPGMNGFEVCQRIKGLPAYADIPILFVTAYSAKEDKLTGFELGGVDYITKPIEPDEVRARVNTHVRLYHLQRDYLMAKLAAENAAMAKTSFLSAVSHELRSPLNVKLGSAELLGTPELGPLTEAQQTYVDRVSESGNALLQRVNDVIDFTQIDTDASDLQFESINPEAVARSVFSSFEGAALQKQIKLRLVVDSDIGLIRADRLRCRQVLANLVENAVKFTPMSGIVTLSIERDGPGHVRFSVRDTGPGIAKAVAEQLFTDQYLVDMVRQAAQGGKGIGLVLCRRFVELHNGSIGVKTKRTEGSTFWFTMPLAEPNGEEALSAESAQPIPIDPKRYFGKRALTIDSDAAGQDILETMLTMEGLQVSTSPTVGDAVRRFAHQRFDVVFAELVNPGVNGAEAVPVLRKHFQQKDLPIVVTSSISHNAVVRACIAQGVQDYLIKPIRRQRLIPRLDRILR